MKRPPIEERQGAVEVVQTLRGAGHEAFLVGGCVRDALLGRTPREYDIATGARPEAVQKLFKRTVGVGAQFGVILVLWKGREYEVATFRAEANYTDGRRPDNVSFVSAREDVIRRDFTINGMLQDPMTGEIRDFVDGQKDLEAKTIRAIGVAVDRFEDDHLRMLRAVRFAATLGFTIEPETLAAIQAMAPKVTQVSGERVHAELSRLFGEGDAARGFDLLRTSGLLQVLLPEAADDDTAADALSALEPDSLAMALSVLLSECDAPTLESISRRWRLANVERTLLQNVVRSLPRFDETLDRVAQIRFVRTDWWPVASRVARAIRGAAGQSVESVVALEALRGRLSPEQMHPERLMTGEDLKALGLQPGPQYKDILTALEDAQLAGDVTSRTEAEALVQSLVKE